MSLYSDCCSALPDKTFDCLCGACFEHCEFWDDEETECGDCGEPESRCECVLINDSSKQGGRYDKTGSS